MVHINYVSEPPDMVDPDVTVLDDADRQETPAKMVLQWFKERLTWSTTTTVTISLWGYRWANRLKKTLNVSRNRWRYQRDVYFSHVERSQYHQFQIGLREFNFGSRVLFERSAKLFIASRSSFPSGQNGWRTNRMVETSKFWEECHPKNRLYTADPCRIRSHVNRTID